MPNFGSVWDVRNGDKLGDGIMPLEEDVEWICVGESRYEEARDVVGEGGRRRGCEELHGNERFIFNSDQEAEGVGLEKLVELGGKLLRGCKDIPISMSWADSLTTAWWVL